MQINFIPATGPSMTIAVTFIVTDNDLLESDLFLDFEFPNAQALS
jgi:hypothetical protein